MKNKMVLQPVRFVDAHYDFTPTQKDFIMMVQYKTGKLPVIKSDFKIDLKSYFKEKGVSIENVHSGYYKELCQDLLSSKVGFQYFKGNAVHSYYNLFSHCSISKDLELTISIIDDVLPLFYINKLNEGHFKNNKLVKTLFEKAYPEYDNYVAYLPKTYVNFEESSLKRLFEKLLQYKTLGKKTYEFSKDELYFLLGYGEFIEKEKITSQQNMFDFKEYTFKQTKYKGRTGWQNLSKKLNIWLQTISENKKSTITIATFGKRFYKTVGRPLRSIIIEVKYDGDNDKSLDEEQIKSFEFLNKYGLSDKQKYAISKNNSFDTIKSIIHENIIAIKGGFGEFKTSNYRKIENVAGFIFSLFLKHK